MTNQALNICTRCGKPRVEVKTWKECIKGSIIIHTSTACPDADCQKIVAGKFAIQKQKREAQEKERLKRAQARKK
jgi:hypothetical protein